MVIVMGFSKALGVSVSTVGAVWSPDSSLLRSSLDGGVHCGHGFREATPLLAARREFEPSAKAVTSSKLWRRESSFRGGRRASDFTVQASSSSDETNSGEKSPLNTENVPGWAKPNSDELPPWAKNERPASQEPAQEFSFGVYLIGSSVVAIAAVGSVFEYFNKHSVFGVIPPDSPFYAPILGLFAISGLPTAGFLFYKSIQLANKASEEADKEDGFRR